MDNNKKIQKNEKEHPSEIVKRFLKENNNRDLSSYKKYIAEFSAYSDMIFEYDTIFSSPKKDLQDKLTYLNTRIKRNNLTVLGINEPPQEPKLCNIFIPKIQRLQKRLPPDVRDVLPEEQIDMFNDVGQRGWKYLQEQLWEEKRRPSLDYYIKQNSRIAQMKEMLKEYELNREQTEKLLKQIRNQPDFKEMIDEEIKIYMKKIQSQFGLIHKIPVSKIHKQTKNKKDVLQQKNKIQEKRISFQSDDIMSNASNDHLHNQLTLTIEDEGWKSGILLLNKKNGSPYLRKLRQKLNSSSKIKKIENYHEEKKDENEKQQDYQVQKIDDDSQLANIISTLQKQKTRNSQKKLAKTFQNEDQQKKKFQRIKSFDNQTIQSQKQKFEESKEIFNKVLEDYQSEALQNLSNQNQNCEKRSLVSLSNTIEPNMPIKLLAISKIQQVNLLNYHKFDVNSTYYTKTSNLQQQADSQGTVSSNLYQNYNSSFKISNSPGIKQTFNSRTNFKKGYSNSFLNKFDKFQDSTKLRKISKSVQRMRDNQTNLQNKDYCCNDTQLSPQTTKSGVIDNIQVIQPKQIVFTNKIDQSLKINLNNIRSHKSQNKLRNLSESGKYQNEYLLRNSQTKLIQLSIKQQNEEYLKKLEKDHSETKKKFQNRFKNDYPKEEQGQGKPDWDYRHALKSPLGNQSFDKFDMRSIRQAQIDQVYKHTKI